MRKTIFTLFTALCITSVINVAKGQCVITAVPDPTAGYTPTQIVNGNFDEEPWMVFTYNNVTYTTCKDDKDFNSPSDDENGYAQNIVFNGVDGGWNTTDRYFWRSSLFEYTNTNSGTHDYIHNSSIPGTDKYVEMNNFHSCMLYQDLTTYSHDVIRWTLKHAVTTNGNDYQPIRVEIGAPNRDGQGHIINASGWANDLNPQINLNTKAIYRYNGVTDKDGHTSILGFGSASDLQYLRLHNTTSDQRNGWWTAQGIYLIPEGQTVTRFGFISETATNNMGNLLDDLTFTTIIGGLTASYGENGSIVVCGFWGEDDASKHLIIDINNIPHEVDMTAVTGQHFTLTVPEECIGGTVTSIAVYHEDYPGADIEISVNQPISVTAEDVNEVYDGVHSWGITAVVTEPATGYTLTYGASYNDCSLAISPTFMEPGTHYVYYTVSAPGYTTEKRKATVFIDKLPFWNDITITPPTPVTGLIYDRHKHTLITAGSATGGKTMAYAEGTDDVTAPTDGWSTELPVSKLWGNHYIWYKVLGDELHKDSDPGVVTTYIQEPPVYNLNLAIDEVGMGEMHVKASIFSEDFNSGELDLTDEWTNDATYPWLLEGNSLRSGNRNHDNSSSTLRASFDFTHDGSISFRYRVSSENCCDKGYFRIDGATKLDQLRGSVGWTTGTFAVTSGTHTFEWQYTKDVSVSSGDDGFFIDDIILFENLPFASSIGLEHGTIVDLAASANEAYSFVNWTSNNVVVSTEPTYMITITKDTVLTANFQKDFEGAGTEDNPYLIPSTEIWNRLATKVNSGTNYSGKFFRQTADISVTTMVGTNSYPFCGTYDGYNHTLTVDYNTTEGATGPFRYTLGATIKNLHTAGTITTSGKFAGGLIAFAYDANTITNCHSSVYITSSVSGDGTHGGFIGDNESSSTVTTSFEGCVFDGKLLGSNTNCCGGFVGWGNGNVSVSLTNCLFAPQEVTISGSDSYTFARTSTSNLSNISTTNCYYTQLLGGAQGKQCYSVTAGTAVTVAAAGTPSATYDVSGLAFYGTNGFTFNGVRYGGNGDAVSLNLSGAEHYAATKGMLTGSANPYTLTMAAANSEIVLPVASVTTSSSVTSYHATLESAISAWEANSTLTLLADVTYNNTINISNTRTLDLNGYGLTRTGNNGGVINLSSGANFTLKDSDPTKEHKFTISNPKANGAGKAMVNDALTSGYETFTGGYITGGYNNGGAGVLMSGGTFIMNGGTFIGNDADRGSGNRLGWGGAVEVKYGTFTMNGGAIIGNIARYGGGLSVHNDWWDNNSSNPNKGSATINNGLIKYNFSSNHSGGIHTDGANYIHMTGGTIINNYTVGNHNSDVGGGLIISNGTPGAIAGSVIVRGNQSENDGPNNNININVASAQTQAFDLTGGFNSDADVYVYAINWTPSSADAKIAYNATLNDIKYIHSDNADGAGVIFFDGDRDWIYDSTNDEFLPISRTNKHQYNLSQANTIWLSTNASTTHLPDNLAFTLTLASDGNGTAVVKTPLPTGVTNNQNGSYAVDNNTELQLEASPATDYHFVQWQDNNSNNPRTITVTENATYTAIFAIDEYRIDSIPTSWQVKIGEGDSFAPTPYGDEHPDSGYVMIPVGAEFFIIPSEDQKHLVSKLELIDKTPILDLSLVTTDTIVPNGWTVTGTLGTNVKVSIADGATVTLSDATINGENNDSYQWAGLNCLGNATIILADGTTNTVKGFYWNYPGIHIPSGYTLTIQGETAGTGSLNASSNGFGAGIGGGISNINCGNITITGGIVTATGSGAAGIGGGCASSCGTITISGGTIDAIGGLYAAGIGSGSEEASCGDITIENTVTRVTATKGDGAPNSIGKGYEGSCGTVTIGGVVYWGETTPGSNSYEYKNGGDTYLTQSPLVYPTSVPEGAIKGKFTINENGDQVFFAPGNLQYQASTSTWRFAENQWDYVGDETKGNVYVGEVKSNNASISSSYTGWIDLFGWGTSGISGYTPIATCYQPYSTSTNNNQYNPYDALNRNLYDGGDNAGKADWGYAASAANLGGYSTWRTLKNKNPNTDDEWTYIFDNRTTGVTVNETENARYTMATINKTALNDNTGVNGIILFPDSYAGPTSSTTGITFGTINGASSWGTKCTTTGWASLEEAGCVFLPAAGRRMNGTSVNDVGSYGFYWSSSYNSDQYARNVSFNSGSVNTMYAGNRSYGYSVRLVRDAN